METMSWNVYDATCPSRQVLDLIADKWATLIVALLEDRPWRFAALQRHIGGISQKMLTQTLRDLERDGLMQRTVYAQVPPRVEYALTPLGKPLANRLLRSSDGQKNTWRPSPLLSSTMTNAHRGETGRSRHAGKGSTPPSLCSARPSSVTDQPWEGRMLCRCRSRIGGKIRRSKASHHGRAGTNGRKKCSHAKT